MTLLQKRDVVLESLRVQFRSRVREIIVGNVLGRVDRIALASRDEEIDPRLEAFLLDAANNITQALADDGEVDETPDNPGRVH